MGFSDTIRWVILLMTMLSQTVLSAESPANAQAVGEVKPQIKSTQKKQKPTFNIFEFKVLGNTVLETGSIEESVYDFMGEHKTIDDVQAARKALEKTYHDKGYLTVSVVIPQQDVDNGLVTLKVVEGTVEQLRVKNSQYHSLKEIKSRVAEFSEGKVPHFPTVQKQLATVNRSKNRQVAPVLRPGKAPGKLEVDLKVKDELPLHGSLELNDRYSPNTTETRLNGALRYENLWQKDHSLGVSFQVSPEDTDEVKVVSANYVIPLDSGDYFAAYGVISRSNISVLGDINVIGDGEIVGMRYIHALPRLEHYYHTVSAGVDYKNFDETLELANVDGGTTPIAYTMFNLDYNGTLNTKQFQTQAGLGVKFSTRALGNSSEEFRNKRDSADPNFAVIRADIKHLHSLPKNWKLQAKLSAQAASGALISPEQFTVGGIDTVRGYPEANALGDKGVFASLELRTPSIHQFLDDFLKDFYLYTFIDSGYTKVIDPGPGQLDTFDLLSAGLGLSIKAEKGLFAVLDYAHAMEDAGDVESGDDRLHFRVGYEW